MSCSEHYRPQREKVTSRDEVAQFLFDSSYIKSLLGEEIGLESDRVSAKTKFSLLKSGPRLGSNFKSLISLSIILHSSSQFCTILLSLP